MKTLCVGCGGAPNRRASGPLRAANPLEKKLGFWPSKLEVNFEVNLEVNCEVNFEVNFEWFFSCLVSIRTKITKNSLQNSPQHSQPKIYNSLHNSLQNSPQIHREFARSKYELFVRNSPPNSPSRWSEVELRTLQTYSLRLWLLHKLLPGRERVSPRRISI